MFLLPEIAISICALVTFLVLGLNELRKPASLRRRAYIAIQFVLLSLTAISSLLWLVGGAISTHYGGNTWNGKIENGLYFVKYKSTYTQVSVETWQFLERVEFFSGGWMFLLGILAFGLFIVTGLIRNRIAGVSISEMMEN